MKKFIKSFTVVLIAVCAAVACAFAVSACKNDDPAYTFIIQYEDGTAVNGQTGGSNGGKIASQFCANGQCKHSALTGIYPDENGKITLTQAEVNELFGSTEDVTVFEFHVLNVSGYKDDCAFEINGMKEYICKLYK